MTRLSRPDDLARRPDPARRATLRPLIGAALLTAALGLTGCLAAPASPLSLEEARPTKLAVHATLAPGGLSEIQAELDFAYQYGCPPLDESVGATLDGVRLDAKRRGGRSGTPSHPDEYCSTRARFTATQATLARAPGAPASAALKFADSTGSLALQLPTLFAPRALSLDSSSSSLHPGGFVVLDWTVPSDVVRAWFVDLRVGTGEWTYDETEPGLTPGTDGKLRLPISADLPPGAVQLAIHYDVTPTVGPCPVAQCEVSYGPSSLDFFEASFDLAP